MSWLQISVKAAIIVELIKWNFFFKFFIYPFSFLNLENRECPAGDCTGPTKRFSSCNTQKCPRGTIDYRTEQCSKFNSVPFERKMYQWIPYLKAPRKCELNCMPKGERFYYRHSKKVSESECSMRLDLFSKIFLYVRRTSAKAFNWKAK